MIKELLKKLKELNLPKGKFAIFGSGPMCVRGLREIGDLDIMVTDDVYNEFKKRPDFKAKKDKNGNEYLEKDNIEIYADWHLDDWDEKKMIQEAEIIDGFPFVRLEEVLRWKKLRNREKDIKDIKLIEEYLEK